MPAEMAENIAAAIDEQNNETVTATIETRMNFSSNGPVVAGSLRRQSGRAVKSIRVVPAEIRGDTVVGSYGSNLVYVRAQEEGYIGIVSVRAHTRRRFSYGQRKTFSYFNATNLRFELSSRRPRREDRERQATLVRAHTRMMNLPARHFFRDTLTYRVPQYSAAISAAIVAAWGNEKGNRSAQGAILR